MPEKPTFEEYLEDFAATLGFPGEPTKAEQTYTFNLRSAHQAVTAGEPLAGILSTLNEIPPKYATGRPDLLFYPSEVGALSFTTKPFKSTIHKIYRRNVLFNRNYPEPPSEGAIDLLNFYETIDDLIRTRIVCKYMDGPRFTCEELKQYCENAGLSFYYRGISTDAGYYAWHFYFQSPVELMLKGVVQRCAMWAEIQLSTQLVEVITSLTHGLYEERRAGAKNKRRDDWKWDAGSQRFRSAYLGHALHLLEGVIQTFRDDVLKPSAPAAASEVDTTGYEAQIETPPDGDMGEASSREDEN